MSEKEKMLGEPAFPPFPTMFFSRLKKKKKSFTLILSSANAFSLDQSKNLLFGEGLTHYQMTLILDSSKLKEFADNNFKFNEISRKLSKWAEKTVGKGEIARYEQFLHFPPCFQKACFPGASKGVIVWEWVKLIMWKEQFS